MIGLEYQDFDQLKLPQMWLWLLKGVLAKLNGLSEEVQWQIKDNNPMPSVTVASAMLLGEQLTDKSLESLVQEVKRGRAQLGLMSNMGPMVTARKLAAQQAAGENVRTLLGQICRWHPRFLD